MHKLIIPGRIMFAIGILGLGVLCIVSKDFIVGRPPAWPEGLQINPGLAYVSGTLLILAAIAIIFNKKGGLAAILIAALIFILSVLRCLPHFTIDALNAYKCMALFGGALIIASSFTGVKWVHDGLKYRFILTGYVLLAVFFIACGWAHFKFVDFVRDFIPAYIPFRTFWAYFCGICLFAGGIGLVIPATRKWAALLSGIMLLGWFLLLHIPRFITNMQDASDRMGLCESFALSGIFFALAGMVSRKE